MFPNSIEAAACTILRDWLKLNSDFNWYLGGDPNIATRVDQPFGRIRLIEIGATTITDGTTFSQIKVAIEIVYPYDSSASRDIEGNKDSRPAIDAIAWLSRATAEIRRSGITGTDSIAGKKFSNAWLGADTSSAAIFFQSDRQDSFAGLVISQTMAWTPPKLFAFSQPQPEWRSLPV
jgi:hypothetical protein